MVGELPNEANHNENTPNNKDISRAGIHYLVSSWLTILASPIFVVH